MMMAAGTKVNFVILFEDEVRAAAKAVRRMHEMPEDVPQEEFSQAAHEAFAACFAALNQADRDDVVLMLGRKVDMALNV